MTKVSKGIAKAGISIGGVSVLGTAYKDGGFQKTEDKISEVKDFVGRVKENGFGEVLRGISPLEQDEIDGQPSEVEEYAEIADEVDIEELGYDEMPVQYDPVDFEEIDDPEEEIVINDHADHEP